MPVLTTIELHHIRALRHTVRNERERWQLTCKGAVDDKYIRHLTTANDPELVWRALVPRPLPSSQRPFDQTMGTTADDNYERWPS